jgi:dolichyl-phosphate beta-glucosyltransferase
MSHLAIIVPCYNEVSRLDKSKYLSFIQQCPEVKFYFVNDGSQDDTIKNLEEIRNTVPEQIQIIDLKRNGGKGEAVRIGMNAAIKCNAFDFIGYLDADLSTSLNEFYKIYQYGLHNEADLILASRIKKVDTVIERSFIRHIIGRAIATLIDQRFKLGIYDTQCGAKIIKTCILQELVFEKFHTKWFFDVELFIRLRKEFKNINAIEIPLSTWKSVKGSSLNFFSFPNVLKDLFILFTKY